MGSGALRGKDVVDKIVLEHGELVDGSEDSLHFLSHCGEKMFTKDVPPISVNSRAFLAHGNRIHADVFAPFHMAITESKKTQPFARLWKWTKERGEYPEADPGALSASGEEMLRRGIRVDFLIDLTCELNIWHYSITDVIQLLLKPITEAHGRSRFSDLPFVRPFTGLATVFVSCSCGGSWGDIIAGACAGAPNKRFLFIEALATRQWLPPSQLMGFSADADLRDIMSACLAVIVVVPCPLPSPSGWMLEPPPCAMSKQISYIDHLKLQNSTSRWSLPLRFILELFIAVDLGITLVFKCSGVDVKHDGSYVAVSRDFGQVSKILQGLTDKVDVAAALRGAYFSSLSWATLKNEATQARKNIHAIDRTVVCSLKVGAATLMQPAVAEVYDYLCTGKPWTFESLPAARSERHVIDLFMAACVAGSTDFAQYVFSRHPQLLELVVEKDYFPLYISASLGHSSVVGMLLERGANPNKVTGDVTPLLKAASNGHFQVAEMLLRNGAEADKAKKNGVTPLFIACQNGFEDILELLIQAGSTIQAIRKDDGAFPLFLASQNGHGAIVDKLILHGAQVNRMTDDSATPLIVAASRGHVGVVHSLMMHGAEVDQPKVDGASPLFGAAHHGHDNIVSKLLRAGANVNRKKKVSLRAPLHFASEAGHVHVIKVLVKAGADVNMSQKNGMTPLFLATQNAHLDAVQLLLKSGAKVDRGKVGGTTPLIVAASRNYVEIVHILLNFGVALDATSNGGEDPLTAAAQNGHYEVVKLLLDSGNWSTLKPRTAA